MDNKGIQIVKLNNCTLHSNETTSTSIYYAI